MKNNNVVGIAFLIVLALATVWFNREADSPENQIDRSPSASADYLLAVSWQPAFCEQRPNKPECRSQRASGFDASNFSLHGLWPQPAGNSYCGVSEKLISTDKSGNWRSLPKLDLSNGLRNELAQKMPGYRSFLHRHEWYKHGTCIKNATPEQYYRVSLILLDQLNNSAVRTLFKNNVGNRLKFATVQKSVREGLGKASADRFILDCYRDNGRRILHEIKLSLSGDILKSQDLTSLIAAGDKMPRSCPAGIVDPVGIQ